MDLFQAMSVYVKVVECGSMTAAADVCGLSTTMVGNYLRGLEQRLGVRLLNRTTRRQRLTEFGESYYRRCQEVLGLVADSERLAEQTQQEASGSLRLTAPVTFGTERLIPALRGFIERYPKVHVEVELSNQRHDLLDSGFDLAVRLGPPTVNGLIARPLQDYTLTVCASPDYLARRGIPRHPGDLAGHDCLSFAYPPGDDWSPVQKEWRFTTAGGDVEAVAITGSVLINNSAGLHQAARAGIGVMMLPDALLEDDLRSGRLVALLTDYRLPAREMNLLYSPDRYRLPKLRAFVEYAVEMWGK